MIAAVCTMWLVLAGTPAAAQPPQAADQQIQAVIDEVEKACLRRTVCMIGPQKAKRLAELVRQAKPELVVECGTAIGYSGLWIARELKTAGRGRLVSMEIDPDRANQAQANFRRAGLEKYVTVKVGDARKLVKHIEGPIDFAFLDCGYSNYFDCLKGMQPQLAPGAVIVADNVGIGAASMKQYLHEVRSKYHSKTEWFDLDLPWARRDAMEISVLPKGTTLRVPFERPLSKIADSLKASLPEHLRMFRPLRVGASKETDCYRMRIVFTFQGREDPSLRLRMECRLLDRGGDTVARAVILSPDPRIVAREATGELGWKRAPIRSLDIDIPKDAIDRQRIESLELVIATEAAQ